MEDRPHDVPSAMGKKLMDARVTSTKSTSTLAKAPRSASFDEAAKARIHRQHLQGTSVEALADQFGRSTAGILWQERKWSVLRVKKAKMMAKKYKLKTRYETM